MTSTTKLPLIAGAIFFALGIIGTLILPTSPDFVAPPGEIASYFTTEGLDLLPTYTMYMLGGAAFLCFAGLVADRLRGPEGERRGIAYVALAGGAATGAALLAQGAMGAVAVLRADEQGAIDPQLAAALFDIGNIFYGLVAPTAAAVLVGAVAFASLRGAFMPRWLGALSAVFALALLIPPISHAVINGLGIWALVVGVALALNLAQRPRVQAAPARA